MEIERHTEVAAQSDLFFQPAEWSAHRAVWLAWPYDGELWQENLTPAQAEFCNLCQSILDVDSATRQPRGEKIKLVVPHAQALSEARAQLGACLGSAMDFVEFFEIPYGDVWLRDTAPIFLNSLSRGQSAAVFRFNGWGEKYVLPGDDALAAQIAKASGLPLQNFPLVLEGGSVDVDGEGTLLTTEQCLLNPNRNPGLSRDNLESILQESLGVQKVLWLGDGLLNDHTDGHVDTVARFVAPGRVICMATTDVTDPNYAALAQIALDLESMTDARGRKLEVVRIPSPGVILDDRDELMPASYVNFYIGNTTVVVPTYGSARDAEAVEQIARCFPGRRTVGLSARSILSGGGAFHCISQQEPQ